MPSYMTIDILCPQCNTKWDSLEERNNIPESFTCEQCGCTEAKRAIGTPMILQASYLSGQSRGQRYENAKQIQRLKVQRASSPDSARKDIDKEILIRQISNQGKTNKFGE